MNHRDGDGLATEITARDSAAGEYANESHFFIRMRSRVVSIQLVHRLAHGFRILLHECRDALR